MTQLKFLCLALIFTSFLSGASIVHAAEGTMLIRVNLVSCGEKKADLPKACKKDDRCCAFLSDEQLAKQSTPQAEFMNAALGSANDELNRDPADPTHMYTE